MFFSWFNEVSSNCYLFGLQKMRSKEKERNSKWLFFFKKKVILGVRSREAQLSPACRHRGDTASDSEKSNFLTFLV